MALMPKRVSHRKHQRGRIRGTVTRGNFVQFGEFGLQSLEPKWISARQIEAGRVAANHFLQGEGRVYIRMFPDKPVTAKPAETRMGKGKGEPEYYAAVIRPGQVIFEVAGVPEELAKLALARTAAKLPVRCRFVHRKIKI
jgi:large subunit ribosomal protein L16